MFEVIESLKKKRQTLRVVPGNSVCVLKMPIHLANECTIRSPGFFGEFGLIERVVIKPIPPSRVRRISTATVYIRYHNKEDGIKAVALGSTKWPNMEIRFGAMRYCNAFLDNMRCKNELCNYWHCLENEEAHFSVQELNKGKNSWYGKKLIAEYFQKLEMRKKQEAMIDVNDSAAYEDYFKLGLVIPWWLQKRVWKNNIKKG
ncbi:CCR4-NOT transcription complex subunit 4 [Trichinella papuae]|uniref:CCR4-NOT transcription complex subunit 4 n=1 Tax=Trichinella papuae TaxID=268474 RepID=A0A0V1N5W6_9BILA|nr:CCR4-NOT transcription complex subunit 4 [Trichinella papuae]